MMRTIALAAVAVLIGGLVNAQMVERIGNWQLETETDPFSSAESHIFSYLEAEYNESDFVFWLSLRCLEDIYDVFIYVESMLNGATFDNGEIYGS